jgi:hypothetical protein
MPANGSGNIRDEGNQREETGAVIVGVLVCMARWAPRQ